MSEENCKNCKHWVRSDISDRLLDVDEQGLCLGLMNGPYSVEVDSELIDNLTIDEIDDFFETLKVTTDYDFYCRNYQKQKEIK